MIEHIAYGLIIIGMTIHAYDSIRDNELRETKELVLVRQAITAFLLLGTIAYGFADGYGVIMLLFVVITLLSSFMLGLNLAVHIEDSEQGISKGLAKKRRRL